MKESNYNLYSITEKGVICFNTLHYTFSLLPTSLYSKLIECRWDSIPYPQKNILIRNGFITEDDNDEYDILQEENKNETYNSATYNLTILPSLDCNLRCWYCFEKHIKDSHLEQSTHNNILAFVENLLTDKQIKYLNIELFGGEPLLYFETELYPLLKEIKKKVQNANKIVNFLFVTNATCIEQHHIALFADLKARFQISIDGYKDKHNHIKRDLYKKVPTYERVINTLHNLSNGYKECHINLRINYDNETLQHIPEVIQDISDIDPKKIGFHLERVWQTSATKDPHSLKEALSFILSKGFTVSYMNLFRRSCSCRSSKLSHSIISYDNKVYKCSGRDFTQELQTGILTNLGIIEWNEEKKGKWFNIKTDHHIQCYSCKLLPLCWGPCNQKQLEHPDKVLHFCQLKNMEISLEEYVYFLFNNELIKRKLDENSF